MLCILHWLYSAVGEELKQWAVPSTALEKRRPALEMSEPNNRMPLVKNSMPSFTLPQESATAACSFTTVQPDPEKTMASLHQGLQS